MANNVLDETGALEVSDSGMPGNQDPSGSAAERPGGGAAPGDTEEDQQVPFQDGLDFILDIPLQITVELGRTSMLIHDLLKLGQGSVIELPKPTGETLEIMANQKLIARGEVVAVNDNYGIRLTEIVSPMERVKRLK